MNTGRYSRVDNYNTDTNLSSSWLPSRELFDWLRSRPSLATPATPSPAGQQQPMNTSGRRTQGSQTHNLNLDQWPSREIPRSIGTLHGNQPRRENSMTFLQTSESIPTTPYAASPKTTWWQNQWNESWKSSGERLEQESPEELGKKLDGTLTPKFLVPNSGMATMDRIMSSSTNSPVKLASNTCSVGATDTPCPSKRRVRPLYLGQEKSGSPATSTQETGIRQRQNLKRKLSFEDCE